MVKQGADDAMVIPILTIPYPLVTQNMFTPNFSACRAPAFGMRVPIGWRKSKKRALKKSERWQTNNAKDRPKSV